VNFTARAGRIGSRPAACTGWSGILNTRDSSLPSSARALFGEGVVHWPRLLSVGLFPVIVALFFSLARTEEQPMLAQFGEPFRAYRHWVPMFIPRWGPMTRARQAFGY